MSNQKSVYQKQSYEERRTNRIEKIHCDFDGYCHDDHFDLVCQTMADWARADAIAEVMAILRTNEYASLPEHGYQLAEEIETRLGVKK